MHNLYVGDNKWIQIHPEAQEAIQNDSEDSKMLWPQGRHFHSAVTYRRQMIICGGKSNGYMNDLHAFDYSKILTINCDFLHNILFF